MSRAVLVAFAMTCKPAPPMHGPVEVPEADVVYHRAWQQAALERVPDPTRGGPAVTGTIAPLPAFLGVDRAQDVYVGSEVCVACHPAEGEAWRASDHARAFATLERKQSAHDPRCLRCHTVGLGHPGGFLGEPELRDVGCESCHGPGSAHVATPEPGYGDLAADATSCVACHDLDTSPDFRFEERWPVIAH